MGFRNWMPTCYMSKYSTPLLINLVSLCWQSGMQVEMNVPIHSRCSERDFDPLLLKTQRSFKKLWMFKVHKFLSIILRSTFKMVDIVKDKIFFFFLKCRWGGGYGGNRSTQGENHRPVASYWHTLPYNVSSTPCLSRIRTHNVSGDKYWLYRLL